MILALLTHVNGDFVRMAWAVITHYLKPSYVIVDISFLSKGD